MYEFVESENKALLNKADKIIKLTKKQKSQIKEMKKLLEKTKGAAAISANQLGITDLRAFVCKNGNEITTIINPKITWTSMDDPTEIIQNETGVIPKSMPMWEGCLSFPGKNYLITRPYAIKVEYMNEKEVYKNVVLNDQWARLFCHEIDHLNGVRVIDKAEEVMDMNDELPIGYYPIEKTTDDAAH